LSVVPPMILIEFLLAPTVPSAPRPKKRPSNVPGFASEISSPTGSERNVTSSTIPTVNWFFGSFIFRFSNTASICAGVVSFDERP